MGVATSRVVVTKNAILETAKEAGRIAFFAAVAALVGWLSNKLAGINPDSMYYVLGTLALKLADKYVHVTDKTSLNGIAPF